MHLCILKCDVITKRNVFPLLISHGVHVRENDVLGTVLIRHILRKVVMYIWPKRPAVKY